MPATIAPPTFAENSSSTAMKLNAPASPMQTSNPKKVPMGASRPDPGACTHSSWTQYERQFRHWICCPTAHHLHTELVLEDCSWMRWIAPVHAPAWHPAGALRAWSDGVSGASGIYDDISLADLRSREQHGLETGHTLEIRINRHGDQIVFERSCRDELVDFADQPAPSQGQPNVGVPLQDREGQTEGMHTEQQVVQRLVVPKKRWLGRM